MPILLSIVLLLNIFDSTVAKKEEALVGTWNVVHCSSNTPTLPPTLIQETTVDALSSVYTFNPDGTFHMSSRFAREGESGVWSLDLQTGTLAMYYTSTGHRPPEYYSLTSLEEPEMVWVLDLGPSGSVTLTLQRGNSADTLMTTDQ